MKTVAAGAAVGAVPALSGAAAADIDGRPADPEERLRDTGRVCPDTDPDTIGF